MKTPNIDLKELKKLKEENFKDRLEFIGKYAKRLKETHDKQWSSEQKDIING
jgi:hypothetical protein